MRTRSPGGLEEFFAVIGELRARQEKLEIGKRVRLERLELRSTLSSSIPNREELHYLACLVNLEI